MRNLIELVDKVLFSSQTDEWITPPEIYDPLYYEFKFKTDPCTTKDNPLKCEYFYTKQDDGLHRDWMGSTFINPPYGRKIKDWIAEVRRRQLGFYDYHNQKLHRNIVMLLPARTDTSWFHQYIWNIETNKPRHGVEIRFIKGRITFVGAKNPAPFPSMIVIFYHNI